LGGYPEDDSEWRCGGLKESTETKAWKIVSGKRRNKNNVTTNTTNAIKLHNASTILSLSNNPTINPNDKQQVKVQVTKLAEADADHKQECQQWWDQRRNVRNTLRCLQESKELFLDGSITQAEDDRTTMAKEDTSNAKRAAIDTAHKFNTTDIELIQQGRNIVYNIGSAFKWKKKNITGAKHVRFSLNTRVHIIPSCHEAAATVSIIYNLGVDGHYITKTDWVQAQLPILQKASKRVAVANGETCKAKFVTHPPFHTLSTSAKQAETFTEFPHSLMSVGKTANNSMISIFTKEGVKVHKEQDILITCKGKPILIGVRNDHGRYRIPLVQQHG
jgi:hypothetical protein